MAIINAKPSAYAAHAAAVTKAPSHSTVKPSSTPRANTNASARTHVIAVPVNHPSAIAPHPSLPNAAVAHGVEVPVNHPSAIYPHPTNPGLGIAPGIRVPVNHPSALAPHPTSPGAALAPVAANGGIFHLGGRGQGGLFASVPGAVARAQRGNPGFPGFHGAPGFRGAPGFHDNARAPWNDMRWRQANPAQQWRWDTGYRAAHPGERWKWDAQYRARNPQLVPQGWTDSLPDQGGDGQGSGPGYDPGYDPSGDPNQGQDQGATEGTLPGAAQPVQGGTGVDGHAVSHYADRIMALLRSNSTADHAKGTRALRLVHKQAVAGDPTAKATLDLVLRMRATQTGAWRPAPPPRRGGFRPRAPRAPLGRPFPHGFAPRRPWGAPVVAPAFAPAFAPVITQPYGIPTFGPGGGVSYETPGSLDAMEAASTPDAASDQAADPATASTDATDPDAAGMSPFRAWARKFPTWFRWGSSSDASGSRGGHHHHHHHHHHHRPQQDQDQGQDQGGDGGGSDASGAHGWGGGARGGFGRGWGGAGWGKGLYGGAWQGAYVPVYNPALLDPEAWSAYGETEGYDVPQDPSQGAPDASGNAGYGDLWPYSEPTTVLAGNPFSRPAPSRPGEHGGFWDYGYGGQMGGLWPYESAAQPLTGSSPFSHGPASTGAYAGPGIRGGAIRGVVTERDLVDAIARIEHYAAVINHDINANPPALPGAADAWRAYVKGLLVRLQGMRQADKTIFSAGALADLLVTEAAGLNAARAILVAQGAALTNMPALVLPFAGAQASSGVWHWATFGLTLGGLVVLDKITRAIRARYARQGLAAKIASAKAPPGAVSGLWSWPTMMWTLGGTTLLDLATKDRAWARSHLLPHLNATGGPSSLIIAASTPLSPAPPAPPPPPPPAAGNYRGYRASYPRRHPY